MIYAGRNPARMFDLDRRTNPADAQVDAIVLRRFAMGDSSVDEKRTAAKAANWLREKFGDDGLCVKINEQGRPVTATFTVNGMEPSVGLGESAGEAASRAMLSFAESLGWQDD